jgi:hypothetical protein
VNGLVRDRFVVNRVRSNEFVGEKAERPASAPIGRLAAGKGDEVSFVVTVEFAFVVSVGVAAVDRRNPSVSVAFACAVGR